MAERKALGKGLGALIPGAESEAVTQEAVPQGKQVLDINVADIEANPHQPRNAFDPKAISELAQSIREKGIIQPLSVRRFGSGVRCNGAASFTPMPCSTWHPTTTHSIGGNWPRAF